MVSDEFGPLSGCRAPLGWSSGKSWVQFEFLKEGSSDNPMKIQKQVIPSFYKPLSLFGIS